MKKRMLYRLLSICLTLTALPLQAETSAVCEDGPNITQQPCATATGFFDLYQQNREENIGNYITEDFWLMAYSLARQNSVAELEKNSLLPALNKLFVQLAKKLPKQDHDDADRVNRDFINVLQVLSGSDKLELSATAQAELEKIMAAEGIASSPLWQISMDYSQFKPRGRYTQSEAEQRYFRAMRYANSQLFALNASPATGITDEQADRLMLQAQRLVSYLANIPEIKTLEQELAWQMGEADDLTRTDLQQVLAGQTNAKPAQLRQLLAEYAQKNHKQPRIIAGLVDSAKLNPGQTSADVMTGWRLLPLRYSAESAAFQRLVFNATGEYQGDKNCPTPFGLGQIDGKAVKAFPSSKELLAALGSPAAQQQLNRQCENQFAGYPDAFKEVSQLLQSAKHLNGEQLRFMQTNLNVENPDDQRRLQSMLSFWTWQRYLNVLYSKQSYTLQSKGLFIDQRRVAMLAPATSLYRSLAQLIKQHQQHDASPVWPTLAGLLNKTINISTKVEAKQPLNDAEQRFLNQLDKELQATLGSDHPIIIDVHTEPSSAQVVEEGVGLVKIVNNDVTRGGRWQHQEFKQPMNNRLTDESWLAQLTATAPNPEQNK